MKKSIIAVLAFAVIVQMILPQKVLALSVSESSLSQIKTDLQNVLSDINALRASIESVIKKINDLTKSFSSSSGSESNAESNAASNVLEITGCEKIECPVGQKVSVLEYDGNGCAADYQCKKTSFQPASSSSKTCPKARTIKEGCVAETVWAKNPKTGGCCKYASACAAPADWKTYLIKSECLKSSSAGLGSAACKTICKKYGYSLGICRSECGAEEARKEEGASSCPGQRCCCAE